MLYSPIMLNYVFTNILKCHSKIYFMEKLN